MRRSARISSASFGFLFDKGEHHAKSAFLTEGRCRSSGHASRPILPVPAKRITRMSADMPGRPSSGRTGLAVRLLMRSSLLLTLLAASVAYGQYSGSYVNTLNGLRYNDIYQANIDFRMSQIIEDRMFQRRMESRMNSTAQPQGEAVGQNAPAQPKYKFALSATDFKPAGKRDVPERLAADSATPEERAQFIEMCRQLQRGIEALPDVRKNNLAAAATILLGSSIQVITQQEIGDDESVDLLRMVNDNIASTPDFKRMTDEQRTAAYDAFLIMGALIVGLDASAKETNDPALATLARELAMNSLAQFGFKAPTVEPSPQAALVSNPVSGSVAAATPPATRIANPRGMLDGIYSGLSSALRVSTGGGLTGDPSRTYVTFYPDGKVYRRVPEGGLESWDRAAAEADVPALWGTYRPLGPGRWEIRWNESTRVGVVQREGEGLRYEDGMVFPVATCEGLVLDGFYALPGYEMNPKPDFIAFYPDGRFVDDRLVGGLAYQKLNRMDSRTVGPGIGRYHIGRNTLHLEYADGRRVPVEIHARPEAVEVRPIPAIYINGWELVRVPQ